MSKKSSSFEQKKLFYPHLHISNAVLFATLHYQPNNTKYLTVTPYFVEVLPKTHFQYILQSKMSFKE